MKNQLKVWLLICSNVALTACTFGNGTICGPLTPVAYCDKEALQKLLHPKPDIESWQKPGMTIEGRKEDWQKCGGAVNGNFSPYIGDLKNERRQGESDDLAAYFRLENELRRCMAKNGYHYVDL